MAERLPNTSIQQTNPSVVSLEKGKIPPQAIDLEAVVLGAMLIDKKGVDEVIDFLHKDVFYVEAHQHIFEAVFQLFQEAQPIDLLTVSNKLKTNEKLDVVGGDYYLIELTRKVGSSAHIEFHARIILQKFVQRSLIKISTEIIEDSYAEPKLFRAKRLKLCARMLLQNVMVVISPENANFLKNRKKVKSACVLWVMLRFRKRPLWLS